MAISEVLGERRTIDVPAARSNTARRAAARRSFSYMASG